MLALLDQGIKVDKYIAYEIDKYAAKTATHNFPEIEQRGNVFDADFTEFRNFDYLMGGSPCTYWSIAQKNNRETEASGLGWELFSQYIRALKEAQPKYFIYENNKSMSNAIRESITGTFGFEPICINSALLSAQNRQRLYWVGKRNADGTYSKVEIEQPADKGILLKDILETGEDLTSNDKSYCMTASYNGACGWNTIERSQRTMVAEPVIFNVPHGFNKGGIKYDKSPTLTAQGDWQHNNFISEPVNTTADGKSQRLRATCYKDGIRNMVGNDVDKRTCVAVPVCMRYERSDEAKKVRKQYEAGEIRHGFHELSELHPRTGGKTNTLSTVLKDNPICEPVRVGSLPRPNGELSQSQAFRVYDVEGKSVNLTSGGGGAGGKTGLYAVPLKVGEVNGGGQGNRIYSVEGKVAEPIGFAIPCEWDGNDKPIKAMSYANGKTYQVYEVKHGFITIKGKEYPIKLADGYYIIRKLTVRECMRLQTVPEWYDFSVVSDTQAYKMLGNGWTVAVISYLLSHTLE